MVAVKMVTMVKMEIKMVMVSLEMTKMEKMVRTEKRIIKMTKTVLEMVKMEIKIQNLKRKEKMGMLKIKMVKMVTVKMEMDQTDQTVLQVKTKTRTRILMTSLRNLEMLWKASLVTINRTLLTNCLKTRTRNSMKIGRISTWTTASKTTSSSTVEKSTRTLSTA